MRGKLQEVSHKKDVLTHLPFEENVLHAILIHVVLQNDRSVQYMSTDSR